MNSLLLGSKKPEARQFKKWVTSEILPSIRKTGAYVSPNINNNQINSLIQLLQQKEKQLEKKDEQLEKSLKSLQESHNQIINLSNKISEIKPRVAIMPNRKKLQHTIFIYKNKNENKYIFIRPQKRNLNTCTKKIVKNLDYQQIFKRENVPNSMNILNKVKEKLYALQVDYKADKNIITLNTNFNLLTLIQDVYNNY